MLVWKLRVHCFTFSAIAVNCSSAVWRSSAISWASTSGGGQQGPLLAAAGAVVTVFDNSPQQLGQDRFVAERDGLAIETVEKEMADLVRVRCREVRSHRPPLFQLLRAGPSARHA
jgi:hypothetical protein